eukprot:scaffold9829_cov26-Tisochrysis_lutea.AAC.2
MNCVRLARVAAILVAIAVREEAAEDAVLGVEDGEVLMDNYLKARGEVFGQPFGKPGYLLRGQIVRRDYALDAI